MPANAVKKSRNKPPIRRVPPDENRTRRDRTIGVSASAEEFAALNEIARIFAFKSGGRLLSWILANLFQLSRNQLHLAVWEADLYEKLRAAGMIEPGAQVPNLSAEILPRLLEQFGREIDKAFGASEKTELGNTSGQTEGGSHGDST